jgi:hypothetical protein
MFYGQKVVLFSSTVAAIENLIHLQHLAACSGSRAFQGATLFHSAFS